MPPVESSLSPLPPNVPFLQMKWNNLHPKVMGVVAVVVVMVMVAVVVAVVVLVAVFVVTRVITTLLVAAVLLSTSSSSTPSEFQHRWDDLREIAVPFVELAVLVVHETVSIPMADEPIHHAILVRVPCRF